MSNPNISVTSLLATGADKMVEALIADPDVVLKTADKSYSEEFNQKMFAPSGGTLQISVADQPQMAAQQVAFRNDNLAMRQVPLTYLNYTTGLEVGAISETFDIGKAVMTQTNKDRMKALAATMAQVAYAQLYTGNRFISSIAAGTNITTSTQMGTFRAGLANQYASSNLFMAAAPEDVTLLAGAMAASFNPQDKSGDAYIDGYVKRVGKIDIFESTLIPLHTNGDAAGTGAAGMALSADITSGATSIAVTGNTVATGTIKAGSILYFPGNGTTAGMNEVNPLTRANTGNKYGVCVAADVTLSGGAGTIQLTQAIYGPENPKYQNVSRLATASPTQYVQLYGLPSTTYRQAFFYKKESALAMVGLKRADLIRCDNGGSDWEGLPIQTAASGDINNLINMFRIDFLGGAALKQPRHLIRCFTAAMT